MLTQRACPSGAAVKRNETVPVASGQEQFTMRGAETLARLRRVIHEGNVRRIWIKGADGRTLSEIPSLLGVRGGLRMLPVWAAVGALASVSGQLTVEVSREPAWPRYAD